MTRTIEIISNVLIWIAMLMATLMMLHICADVIMRGAFGRPLPATGEITAAYYMVSAALLPWAYVSFHDAHFRADLFSRFIPGWMEKILGYVIDLVTLAYVGLIGWQAVVSAFRHTARNELREIPGGFLVVWPARWIVVIAALSMTAVLLLKIVQRVTGATAKADAVQDGSSL